MTALPDQPLSVPAAPRERDRFVTFSQALMIFLVVAAHWFLLVVQDNGLNTVGLDRYFRAPWMSWVLVLVIPTWFGMIGALSKKSALASARTYYSRRFKRLLIPYFVFAAVMVVLELSLWMAKVGACGDPGRRSTEFWFTMNPLKALTWIMPFPHFDCLGITQATFWFLTALLFITLAMPWVARIYQHTRLKYWFPVLLAGTTFACDVGQKVLGGLPVLLLIRILTTWTFFAYIGFFYIDREYERVRRWLLPAAIVCGLVTSAMVLGPYPDYLFGTANDGNQFPPTAAYVMGGTSMILLLVWARESVIRFSSVRGVRPFVDYMSAHNYTIYIWHMLAYAIAWWSVHWIGAWPALSSWPILLRQGAVVVIAVPILAAFVAIFARCEEWDFPPRWLKRRTRPVEAATT